MLFDDESFDVVLSSFGYMFSFNPEIDIKEMIRVIKHKSRIAFSTWPSELLNGNMFETVSKHMSPIINNVHDTTILKKFSPIECGNSEIIKNRLGKAVKNIHFERGVVYIPILSLNHYWNMAITKFGPFIYTIQMLKASEKIESLRKDIMRTIKPFVQDNQLRPDYLITWAIKENIKHCL